MRALRARSTTPAPVLDDVDSPVLGTEDVRIRVAAAAVNPVDVAIATGRLRAVVDLRDPIGLGWDVSGTVTGVGSQVTGVDVGDRVAGIFNVIAFQPEVGTHAEVTVLPAQAVARIPDGLDLVDAASLPLTALTARQALDLLGPAEGRSLLITGGAGAVGGHAISLASRAGWDVTAMARVSDSPFISRNGAQAVSQTPNRLFDAVLDAAVLLDDALSSVRDGGAFVGVAPASPVAPKRDISVHTVTVTPSPAALEDVLDIAADGHLPMRVAGRVPLDQAAAAYAAVAGGGQRGRWLVIP